MALTNSPVIETQNLILRGPEKVDIEPTIAFLQNEERSIFFGALLNQIGRASCRERVCGSV